MAVRNESVRLALEDAGFTTGMAKDAAIVAVFKKILDDLGDTSIKTGRNLDRPAAGVDKVGTSSRKAGPEVDRLSGRLRLMADAGLTVGPALIPLGAGVIPVLTASLVGFTAAAGGIGVSILALKGIGDGLKAIDAFQLEPTTENLQALRVEMDKLGPAGAHFAHFLDDLEPKLRDLQMLARAGLLPGLEDGIDGLLNRLPQLRRIVADIAEGMGDLASDAGEELGGPKFTAFFDYLESDARPTLEAFVRSAGNVALGVANMLVAFAPLNRDFTGGLESATRAFARWTAGLDDNDSFRAFLAYVRDSGPQVVDFLAALSSALVGLIHAAAPLGSTVLPLLTAVAKAFAAIADSPIGPPLYTAAAALIAFNRAARLTNRATTSLSTGFNKVGGDAVVTQGRLSGLLGRGGIVLAGAAAVAMLADNINRIDPENLERSLEALKFGDVTDTVDKVIQSLDGLEGVTNQIDFAEVIHLGGLLGDTSLDKFADNVDQVDQALAQMVESGNVDEAATLFQRISDLAEAKGVDPEATAKRFDAYALALQNVASEADSARLNSLLFGGSVRHLGGDLDDAAQSAQDFSDALSALNGWLDKRQAIRDYRDGIHDLSKALKNGFQPKDADTLDAVGRNIAQVADLIKDRGLRADFLAGARASLVDLANKSGPKAKHEVEELIGALDRYGLTKPPKKKVDVEDKATPKLEELGIKLRRTDGKTSTVKLDADDKPVHRKVKDVQDFLENLVGQPYTATVNADTGQALNAVQTLNAALSHVVSKTITITIKRLGAALKDSFDSGGFTGPGPRLEPRGVVHAGEVVVPQDLVRRDWAMLKSRYGHLPGFAGGGVVPHGSDGKPDASDPHNKQRDQFFIPGELAGVGSTAHALRAALKRLEDQVEASKKVLDKERAKRDDLANAMASLSSSVAGRFDVDLGAETDPWAAASSSSSVTGQVNAATQQALAFPAIIAALQAAGLTGPALAQALQQMSFSQLQQLAQNPTEAARLGASLGGLFTAQQGAGTAAGTAAFGAAYTAQQKVFLESRDELRTHTHLLNEIKQAVDRAKDETKAALKDNSRDTAKGVGDHVNGAAGRGLDNRVYAGGS